jgi:hypothetical protein
MNQIVAFIKFLDNPSVLYMIKLPPTTKKAPKRFWIIKPSTKRPTLVYLDKTSDQERLLLYIETHLEEAKDEKIIEH